MKTCRHVIAILVALAFVAAACSRSDTETETGEGGSAGDGGTETAGEQPAAGDSGARLDAGEFGDLGVVCQDGDAAGSTDVGVTDSEIRIGTVTDKGAAVRNGLNQEMYDTAVAFAAWCNEHGGINGLDIVVDDLDAKLTEYGQRISTACDEDFALVGGGAVFDNADNGQRVDCGLANIAGYVVTPEARVADLQVQPVPNPVYSMPVGAYRRLQDAYPDVTKFGIMWVDLAGVSTVHDQTVEAVETLGFDVVFDATYAPIGETGWRSFVQNMREQGVQAFEMVGEPENLTALQQAMQTEGWYPTYTVLQGNYNETKYEEEGRSSVSDATYIRSAYAPFSEAEDVPGLADYLALMERYNPDGKYPALLGAQALSAWLLFAKSAVACGAELTRACVLDNAAATTDWTGGGMHATTQPGNAVAPDCGLMLQFTPDGFRYDEELTQPNEGVFNCSPDNVLELQNDYGVPRPQP